MDTQILNLQAPFEYIHCNGEVGKHIATMIVYETTKGEDGQYKMESHSHPIVKYHHRAVGTTERERHAGVHREGVQGDERAATLHPHHRQPRR